MFYLETKKKENIKADSEEDHSLMELYEDVSLIESQAKAKPKKKETSKKTEPITEKAECNTQFVSTQPVNDFKLKKTKKKPQEISATQSMSQPIVNSQFEFNSQFSNSSNSYLMHIHLKILILIN